MTWDVTLHCNQCHTNIGRINNVLPGNTTAREPEEIPYSEIHAQMRLHEVEKHGGKTR